MVFRCFSRSVFRQERQDQSLRPGPFAVLLQIHRNTALPNFPELLGFSPVKQGPLVGGPAAPHSRGTLGARTSVSMPVRIRFWDHKMAAIIGAPASQSPLKHIAGA